MKKVNPEWWKEVFGDQYLESYPTEKMVENAESETEKIMNLIPVQRGVKVLDVGCGYGRHSIQLAKMGYEVVGLDYSLQYIKMAKGQAKENGLHNVKFLKEDMRNIPFENEFDVAISLFSSFGYFQKDSDHQQVLNKVSKSLKRGGYFLIDLQNTRKWLKKTANGNFVFSKAFVTEADDELPNGTIVHIQNDFDLRKLKNTTHVSWTKNGRKNEGYSYSIQCFLPEGLKKMLESAGLKPISIFGNYDGDPYRPNKKRLIILSRKK